MFFCSTQHPNIERLLIHKKSQRHTQQIQRNTLKWLRKFCLCNISKNQYLYVAYPCMALRLSLYFTICFDSSYISVCSVNKRNDILTMSCYEMNSWACLGKIVQSLMRFGSWSGPTQTPNMDVLGVAGLISSDNITAQTPHTNQVHDDSK